MVALGSMVCITASNGLRLLSSVLFRLICVIGPGTRLSPCVYHFNFLDSSPHHSIIWVLVWAKNEEKTTGGSRKVINDNIILKMIESRKQIDNETKEISSLTICV